MKKELIQIREALELDYKLQHLKHYMQGYKEFILTKIHGAQAVENMGIDFNRYSTGSASRISYDSGWNAAESNFKLNGQSRRNK